MLYDLVIYVKYIKLYISYSILYTCVHDMQCFIILKCIFIIYLIYYNYKYCKDILLI